MCGNSCTKVKVASQTKTVIYGPLFGNCCCLSSFQLLLYNSRTRTRKPALLSLLCTTDWCTMAETSKICPKIKRFLVHSEQLTIDTN